MRLSQISVGPLFEWLRPALWVISAYLSARTLADARRLQFNVYEIWAWTIGAFLLPFIILPLYLIARRSRRRTETESLTSSTEGEENELTAEVEKSTEDKTSPPESKPLEWWRRAVPLFYFPTIFFVICLYFYYDYHTADAHLMRGNFEKIRNRHTGTIREYEAALRLEPTNAHTHKLLAEEFAAMERWQEALEHFRAAETKGEPDNTLPFRIATMLDALNLPREAVTEYERFVNGYCAGRLDDVRCDAARRRLN
jgi:tetratricopeptide (TPR) repeat protein